MELFLDFKGAHLCSKKPMNGATPVPGPTIIIGVAGSSGRWKPLNILEMIERWSLRSLYIINCVY